jgi:hypothetical protein
VSADFSSSGFAKLHLPSPSSRLAPLLQLEFTVAEIKTQSGVSKRARSLVVGS